MKHDPAPEIDTDFIKKRVEASFEELRLLEEKRLKSVNMRSGTIFVSTLLACISLVVFMFNARPILAEIIVTPDVIARHTSEIRQLTISVAELNELKRDFHNLNGQVNQLRGIVDGQLSVARQLQDSILRLELVTEENNRVNKIHLDNLRDAIRETRQR